MIYGLYNSAAGMLVNEYRQAVIANNLANADTAGFKEQIAVFAERPPEGVDGLRHGPSAKDLAHMNGYLWLGQTYTDHRPGSLQKTDNPTDLALDGPGFFVFEVAGGPQYSRDGRLVMDAFGQLRAATDGAPILDAGGAFVQLNPHGGKPQFDEDGRVMQDGAVVGQLAVVDFAAPENLLHAGSGRFMDQDADLAPSVARVLNGMHENSGVQPVQELVDMIEVSRAYQLNAQMVSMQDQSIGRLISLLSR